MQLHKGTHYSGRRKQRRPRQITLAQFVLYRNGLPLGARGSLQNMLRRSFGASSFAGFWQHWNPIFGYGLARYVYAPLRRRIPASLALIMTFIACGALHDAVTMAVRGAAAFFFTPWFFFMGLAVALGTGFGLNFAQRSWAVRGAINTTFIGLCLLLTLLLRRWFAWP